METYSDAPQVLRNFLSYHENGQGPVAPDGFGILS